MMFLQIAEPEKKHIFCTVSCSEPHVAWRYPTPSYQLTLQRHGAASIHTQSNAACVCSSLWSGNQQTLVRAQLNGHSDHMFPKMVSAEQIHSFVERLSSLFLLLFFFCSWGLPLLGVQLNPVHISSDCFLKHFQFSSHCLVGQTLSRLGLGIPHICHRRHRRRLCKFFLSGVIFFQIEREKLAFYCNMCNITQCMQCILVH